MRQLFFILGPMGLIFFILGPMNTQDTGIIVKAPVVMYQYSSNYLRKLFILILATVLIDLNSSKFVLKSRRSLVRRLRTHFIPMPCIVKSRIQL